MGYLGKVSALVTVNTADIASKVQSGFAAPFDKALRSIESQLRNTNRSIEKSFADIYTPAQKTARAVAAAMMGAVKSFDADGFSKKLQIRDDIADPVKRLASEIEKTSGILRSSFEPRIVALQAESQALFDRMATDAASVASGEITALIRKVETLGEAFRYTSTASERMAAGFAKASAAAAEDRRIAGMFSAASQQAAAARREAAMTGASSAIAWSTPWRRGTAGVGASPTTGVGAFTDISQMGARSVLQPGVLQTGIRTILREGYLRQRAVESSMQGASTIVPWSTPWRRGLNAPAGASTTGVGSFTDISQMGARTELRQGYLQEKAMRSASERMIAGMSAAGRAAEESRRVAAMFTTAGQQAAAMNRELAAMRREAAMVGASSTVSWSTPWRRGLGMAAGAVTTGVGASTDISQMGARTILPAGYLQRRAAAATGDIGRMGADRFSLALQQAAFAVDDFMSATGGLDMKLRAVQNNITQLAFVLGGTTGLFIGLGAAIAGQATLALVQWLRNGGTAADQSKALNDSLEKQRSLVDDLAGSFESLADAIAQSAMSAEALAGRQLDKQIESISKQQKEARNEELYRLSPGVNAARARQNVAEAAIKSASTEADMLAAQSQLAAAKAAEERAKAGVRARASAGVANPEVFSAIVESFRGQAAAAEAARAARSAGAAGGGMSVGGAVAEPAMVLAAASRLAEEWLDRNTVANGGNAIDILRNRSEEIARRGLAGEGFRGDREAMAEIQRSMEIASLPLKEGADDISIAVSRASSEAASKIKEAQDRVAEAIQAGAPGAAMFSVTLGKTAEALTSAQDKVLAAFKESDPERRRAMADEAKREVDALVGTIDKQLSSARGMMLEGLGVKGGRGGELGGVRRVAGAGESLAALEGSAEFGGRSGPRAVALRALIAKESAARADLARAMTFGGGNQRVQAAMGLEAVQDQLQKFTDGLPEEIKAAGDAVKAASKQSGKDAATQAQLLDRGRDLILSPKQKAVAAFRKDLEAASVAAAGPDRAALLSQFMRNRATEVAPLLSQFAQERGLAAMAQYTPALQASDVTTQEGQREINRLLRGEDSAKDVNLAELKQQTELLGQLVEIAQKDQDLVVDFK